MFKSAALRNARANSGITFRPDANTVLWLPGQDDAQSATIRDRSGNENDGILVGTTWAKNGKGLDVLSFDRTDDWVAIPTGASVTGQTQVFLSIWFYATVIDGASQQIFHEPISSGVAQARFELNIADNMLLFQGRAPDTDGLTAWIMSSTVIIAGTWNHALVVFDSVSNNHFMYLNGASETANVAAAAFTVADAQMLRLGARSDAGIDLGGFLILPILEFRLPKTSEISGNTSLYNSQRGLFGV